VDQFGANWTIPQKPDLGSEDGFICPINAFTVRTLALRWWKCGSPSG